MFIIGVYSQQKMQVKCVKYVRVYHAIDGALAPKVSLLHPAGLEVRFNASDDDIDFGKYGCQSLEARLPSGAGHEDNSLFFHAVVYQDTYSH